MTGVEKMKPVKVAHPLTSKVLHTTRYIILLLFSLFRWPVLNEVNGHL